MPPGPPGAGGDPVPPHVNPRGEPGLDVILEEVETVVDPIAESAAFGPARCVVDPKTTIDRAASCRTWC